MWSNWKAKTIVGEIPKAFIVLKEDAEASEEEIKKMKAV